MPKPSPRRDGREAAVQYLFANEAAAEPIEVPTAEQFSAFWELRKAGQKARDFAEEIIRGVSANQEAIDEHILASLENFKLDRLTAVDRNILRIGAYEICFSDDVPAPVAVNEAIEIAKRFGTEDSGKFVNGVLDRILRNFEAS